MNPQAIADSPAAAARPISRPLLLLTNSIPSRVLRKGHFRRAKVGHFWRAARFSALSPTLGPLLWAVFATLPIAALSWWIAYRSDWF